MTATPQTFVRKHTTSFLPIKYVRKSVHSLIHRDSSHREADDTIGAYIETPVHPSSER